jgi:hypothetical protein
LDLELTVSLGASTAPQEEDLAWDDDDDEQSPTPNAPDGLTKNKPSNASTITLTTPAAASSTTPSNDLLKPEPRRSTEDEKSVAGSDASYDIVSGATSRAHGSPKEEKRGQGEESDDDWE